MKLSVIPVCIALACGLSATPIRAQSAAPPLAPVSAVSSGAAANSALQRSELRKETDPLAQPIVLARIPHYYPTRFEQKSCATTDLDEKTSLPYKPGDATIAVVLGPNISSDKWKELKIKEAIRAQEATGDIFALHGFKVVSKDKVDAAVAKLGIDMTSEEQWTKSNLYKLGKELNVEMVAFVVIKQTRQKTVSNILLGNYYEAEAEIEAWLVDAKAEAPVLNDVSARGVAKRGMRDTSARRLSAVTFAVDQAFQDLLKPFPKVTAVGKEK